MTASATPPSRTAWARRGRERLRFRGLVHRRVRRSVRRDDGRAARPAAEPRRRSALQSWRSRSRKPIAAATPRSRCRRWWLCEGCGGIGAEAGHQGRDSAPPAPATARCARSQGFFTIERTCPEVPRHGPRRAQPLQALQGRGPRAEGTHALRRYSAGRRGRHAHPPVGRRPGGNEWRTAGRSLYFPVGPAAPDLPARRHDLYCRVPVSLRDRGARRRDRSADDRTADARR